jgi:mannose-6-phosphate isomerase-like protein (cupin superfamily)
MTEAAEKLPALLDTGSPGKPRLHRSNTIGFVVILSGRLWLEVDDGHELELRQGECVILNGGLHAWHNRSPTPCEIAAVTIGARRLSDTDPPLFRS